MDKKTVLIRLARAAIAEALGISYPYSTREILRENPWLKEKGAAFVTLNRKADDSLRGCIGSIIAHQSLFDDIVSNAKSAALNDPRFAPMRPEEFEQVKVEVSLLTTPKRLEYRDASDLKAKLVPGKDGVILQLQGRQATFLPQVWEQLPTFESFMGNLCLKAGLPQDCVRYHPDIYTYRVEAYHEE